MGGTGRAGGDRHRHHYLQHSPGELRRGVRRHPERPGRRPGDHQSQPERPTPADSGCRRRLRHRHRPRQRGRTRGHRRRRRRRRLSVPQIIPKSFGDSAIVLELRFWIDHPTPPRKWRAISQVVGAVKTAFDEAGIVVPFPQRRFSVREGAADTPPEQLATLAERSDTDD
ncbi:hypothetical protein ACFQL1_18435 [Halomicroarcula sp. GCM10025709]|uniref:hypothetical protein n=1 Tax=Halomicroarcula sp. GCM10025709 TaxID=3252669 RepID=UPI00361A2290